MTKHEGREERSRHDAGWIVYLGHRCVPQLEINGLPAVSVGWREVLRGRPAMLHELEEQVETFFEFDVTIGSCVADALCAAPRREHLLRPARRPRGGRRQKGKGLVM